MKCEIFISYFYFKILYSCAGKAEFLAIMQVFSVFPFFDNTKLKAFI